MTEYLTTYDLVQGKKLADLYTIVGPRRQTGFAAVYEATDPDGQPCEVSFFPLGLFEHKEQAEEFRERFVPWRRLEAQSVLRVRDTIKLAGGLLLVTDLPPGEELRTRLDHQKVLTSAELVALGGQLLEGMALVHALGLAHGDIKPRTIFVSGRGASLRATLVDGGVTASLWNAKGLGEKTALIGTPYYAPMEQFGGDAPDVRSDIYNLATVMYECATGVLPWTGSTFLDVFQSKLKDPPAMKVRAPAVEVDPRIESAILHGCLADRRKRFGSAREFLLALKG